MAGRQGGGGEEAGEVTPSVATAVGHHGHDRSWSSCASRTIQYVRVRP